MARAARTKSRSAALPLAILAGIGPFLLILVLLKPSDLVYVPSALNPSSSAYSDAIERVAGTSDNLITIALAILGATAIWYMRDIDRKAFRHVLLYIVFLFSLISIYAGIKAQYSASLTLATDAPDLIPLLSMIRLQALLSLAAGLLLSAVVVFESMSQRNS